MRMNHLKLETRVGTFCIQWDASGRIIGSGLFHNLAAQLPEWKRIGHWTSLTRNRPTAALTKIFTEVQNYFQMGQPITALKWRLLDINLLTEFQKKVYTAVQLIPHGETRPYSWIAEKTGQRKATRAVGQALRKNPFPVLVPCHRVVSASGLGGFLGDDNPDSPELNMKQSLLELENSYRCPLFPFLLTEHDRGSNTLRNGTNQY